MILEELRNKQLQRKKLIAQIASKKQNDKLMPFIDNETIKEFMLSHSSIARRHQRMVMDARASIDGTERTQARHHQLAMSIQETGMLS